MTESKYIPVEGENPGYVGHRVGGVDRKLAINPNQRRSRPEPTAEVPLNLGEPGSTDSIDDTFQ